jgi:hypothetical protein
MADKGGKSHRVRGFLARAGHLQQRRPADGILRRHERVYWKVCVPCAQGRGVRCDSCASTSSDLTFRARRTDRRPAQEIALRRGVTGTELRGGFQKRTVSFLEGKGIKKSKLSAKICDSKDWRGADGVALVGVRFRGTMVCFGKSVTGLSFVSVVASGS